MSYPLLAPGQLVKPQVGGLIFHRLRVLADPGPAGNPRRIVTLQRTEPQRADQRIRVRRDRVHTDSRVSIFDVKPNFRTGGPEVPHTTEDKPAHISESEPVSDDSPSAQPDLGIPDFLQRKA